MPIEQTDKAAGKNLLAAFFISMLYLIMNINNNNFQKNSNISRIIETIWRQGEVSRIDIARSLELYRSTVSNIIGSLIENNIIIETSSGESLPQGGRKPIYLNLNTNFGCVIGFEIQPKKYHAVIIDLNSAILFSSTEETPSAELDDICASIFPSLIEKTKELGLPLLGICVGLPGIIDSNHGKIIRSIFCRMNLLNGIQSNIKFQSSLRMMQTVVHGSSSPLTAKKIFRILFCS